MSTVAHYVNVTRDDIEKALKTIALRRLLEQSPGLQVDPADWEKNAEVFLPPEIITVQVSVGKSNGT